MEEDFPSQTPQAPGFLLTPIKAIFITVVALCLSSIVAVSTYYIGKNSITYQPQTNGVTPTIQIVPTTQKNNNQPSISPTGQVTQCNNDNDCSQSAGPCNLTTKEGCGSSKCVSGKCQYVWECNSDNDCPPRQGCLLYQCTIGQCRKINMCNQE